MLLVSVQGELTDAVAIALQEDLAERVAGARVRGSSSTCRRWTSSTRSSRGSCTRSPRPRR
ncbi:hypothetical protein ACFQV2_25480 [Actinokineospora soli]|uniref:Uncharacterized protein n=1 Tax=Actinokineospora soli TaxID=1048753 RepID=A0ABW2TSP0_9PSEU